MNKNPGAASRPRPGLFAGLEEFRPARSEAAHEDGPGRAGRTLVISGPHTAKRINSFALLEISLPVPPQKRPLPAWERWPRLSLRQQDAPVKVKSRPFPGGGAEKGGSASLRAAERQERTPRPCGEAAWKRSCRVRRGRFSTCRSRLPQPRAGSSRVSSFGRRSRQSDLAGRRAALRGGIVQKQFIFDKRHPLRFAAGCGTMM